jgi:hypothetical protein
MKLSELEFAFDFVGSAQPCEHSAFVSRSTGQTFLHSEMGELDGLPDDLEESEEYLEIPHYKDLSLGQGLVWEFVAAEIPDRESEIRSFFRGRGAYRLYKQLLQEIGLLERWYEFEGIRRRQAMVEWCIEHDLEVEVE